MMLKLQNLIYILLLLPLLSCKEDEEPLAEQSAAGIQVELKEEFIDDAPRIILYARTVEIFSCANYTIVTDEETANPPYQITFLGIDFKDICLNALGPATARIDLGSLPNGVYNLSLNNGPALNSGKLEVTDQDLKLIFSQPDGIEILTPHVQRNY